MRLLVETVTLAEVVQRLAVEGLQLSRTISLGELMVKTSLRLTVNSELTSVASASLEKSTILQTVKTPRNTKKAPKER